ncbi:phage minor tail protein L [Escherichia coli]
MSEKLKIVYRPLQELSPYAHNARTHSPEQVAQLVESIKQFGWTNPVLIDEKGEIIAGHGRVMAAEMLKMDSVPVIVLSGLTDEQKKAYRLADNRLPMNAGWDEDLLRMELSELSAVSASFVLSTPTETDGAVFPGRIMLANTCTWTYRGDECGYHGPAVADEYDQPTSDITKDKCSKCLSGCKFRNNVGNFGGFLSINKLSQ